MYLKLEGPYQDCLNYEPGVKMAPSWRSLVLYSRIRGQFYKSSCVKLEGLGL